MTAGWELPMAIGGATVAALLFAVSAVLQQRAVVAVVESGQHMSGLLRLDGIRGLLATPGWLLGVVVAATASILHASALVVAPVSIVQPIGVLAVPFAVVIAARRARHRPSARLLFAVLLCLGAVSAFVAMAAARPHTGAIPDMPTSVRAAVVVVAVVVGMCVAGARSHGHLRCLLFAAAGATAFGMVSVLLRLAALQIMSGTAGVVAPGVLIPAVGVVAALLVGGWAVQQAHAAGPAVIVVGCMTVVDPIVAVTLGIVMLGEGGVTAGLVGCAVIGVLAVVHLACQHSDAPTAGDPAGRQPASRLPSVARAIDTVGLRSTLVGRGDGDAASLRRAGRPCTHDG